MSIRILDIPVLANFNWIFKFYMQLPAFFCVDYSLNFPICFVGCDIGLNFLSLKIQTPLDPMWEYGEPFEGFNRLKRTTSYVDKKK